MPRFDIIFVDGGHSYAVVVSDLRHFAERVHVGGLLVVDDASNFLQIRYVIIQKLTNDSEQPVVEVRSNAGHSTNKWHGRLQFDLVYLLRPRKLQLSR